MRTAARLACLASLVMTATLLPAALLLPTPATAAEQVAEIRTVPPVPGFRFAVSGQVVTTDAAGVAPFVVDSTEQLAAQPRAVDEQIDLAPGVRARFSRFYAGSLTAVFDVYYEVSFGFADIDGDPVDPSRVDRLSVRSSTGESMSLPPDGHAWVHGTRVQPSNGNFVAKPIYWTILGVEVGGSQVVNRSQQGFLPMEMPPESRRVGVELLFFDARLHVRDAFFGFPVGAHILLEAPDGHVTRHELDDDASVVLRDLPRGRYEVAVEGPGLTIRRPLTITRPLDTQLAFHSWADVAAAVLAVMTFMVGLALVGWRRSRGSHCAAREPDRGGHDEPLVGTELRVAPMEGPT